MALTKLTTDMANIAKLENTIVGQATALKAEFDKASNVQLKAYINDTLTAEVDTALATTNTDLSTHIADTENPHVVTTTQLSLENVDNTADLDKPISNLTQEALDLKQPITDATLETTAKTVPTAINEVKDTSDTNTTSIGTLASLTTTEKTNLVGAVNELDSEKVDKVTGKSLISDTEITRLTGIETGAQVNIIEDVKLNNTSLTVTGKAVNIDLNTELASLYKGVTYTAADGKLTFTKHNNTTTVIDLPLELIVESGAYDSVNSQIVLTLANANVINIPLTDLLSGIAEIDLSNVTNTNFLNKSSSAGVLSSANHTYDNTASGLTADDVQSAIDELSSEKVDKDGVKVLSTNDYTDLEKLKLAGIDENANNYVLPSDVVQDSTYVHTDNNYTDGEKTKLTDLPTNDELNTSLGEKLDNENDVILDTHIKSRIRNMFDKTKATLGYLDNNGVIQSSDVLSYSNYIEVEPNTKYSINKIQSSAGGFFTSDKTWISKINADSGSTTTFTAPSNAKYVILNVSESAGDIYKETYMLLNLPYFLPVYYAYNNGYVSYYNPVQASKWKGKSIYAFGDSITWYDGRQYVQGAHAEYPNIAKGYLSYMREELGAFVRNLGYNGGSLKNQISAEIKDITSYVGVNAVTITGGVNDWYTGEDIGAIAPIGSTFDLDTSYGSLQSAIEYILNSNPSIKIYLITPIRGMVKETATHVLVGQEFPETYADLIKSVGELYGLPVLDWYNLSGFNKLNYSNFYKDIGTNDSIYIHVGDEGYKRMSEVLIPFLRDN